MAFNTILIPIIYSWIHIKGLYTLWILMYDDDDAACFCTAILFFYRLIFSFRS